MGGLCAGRLDDDDRINVDFDYKVDNKDTTADIKDMGDKDADKNNKSKFIIIFFLIE